MGRLVVWFAEGTPGGVEEGDAKDDADGRGGNAGCEIGAPDRAQGSGHLEKHSDPHIGKTFPDIGDSGTRRSGNHGDEGGTNGVTKVNVEEESESGHDHYAAAQSGESAKQPGEERREQHCRGEFDQETPVPRHTGTGGMTTSLSGTQVEDQFIDVHHLGVVPLRRIFHLIL